MPPSRRSRWPTGRSSQTGAAGFRPRIAQTCADLIADVSDALDDIETSTLTGATDASHPADYRHREHRPLHRSCGRRTAATMRSASACSQALSTASRISATVSTYVTSSYALGKGRDYSGHERDPRATRRGGIRQANPILPDDRLPRNRMGSMGSRVPPAVTTIRVLARSASRRQWRLGAVRVRGRLGEFCLPGTLRRPAIRTLIDDPGLGLACSLDTTTLETTPLPSTGRARYPGPAHPAGFA